MKEIEIAIRPFKLIMSRAADVIVNEDVSRYPIFIMGKSEINAGIPLVNTEDHNSEWNINASTLEEFYTKKMVDAEKIDSFRNLYKKHELELCVFVIDENGANFVFLPA